MTDDDALAYIRALHATVDRLVAPLQKRHAARLACRRGCSGCCQDDLSILEIEALPILRDHPDVLAEGPGPTGSCAFLDPDGACRIYPDRPYVCRTQGLPLRWAERDGDAVVEARDVCPLNRDGTPLEQLPPEALWTLGPVERRLAAAQATWGDADARVRLRDLFDAAARRPAPG